MAEDAKVGKEVEAAGMDGPVVIAQPERIGGRALLIHGSGTRSMEPSGVLQLHVKIQIPVSKAC